MLWILLGEMPLQARENLAWDSRALYLDFGRKILELRDAIQDSVRDASNSLPPDVARRYVQGLSLLTDDGGVNHLKEMVDQLDDMADGQITYSMKIQEAKWEIISEIVMLLIELAFLAAMATLTGGTSISQMALARARSRLAILMTVDRLVRMTHLAPALSEAIEEAIQTLAVKLAQIAFNPPRRKPPGIDWGDIGKAAAFGAFAGLFEGVLDRFSPYVKNWLKNGFGNFDNFVKNNPFTAKILDGSYDVPAIFVVSGISETAAEVVVTGIFDNNWSFKWETFVGSGTSGVFGTFAESSIGAGASWLNSKFFSGPAGPGPFPVRNDLPPMSETGGGGPGPRNAPEGPGVVLNTGGPLSGPPPALLPPPVPLLPPVPLNGGVSTPPPVPAPGTSPYSARDSRAFSETTGFTGPDPFTGSETFTDSGDFAGSLGLPPPPLSPLTPIPPLTPTPSGSPLPTPTSLSGSTVLPAPAGPVPTQSGTTPQHLPGGTGDADSPPAPSRPGTGGGTTPTGAAPSPVSSPPPGARDDGLHDQRSPGDDGSGAETETATDPETETGTGTGTGTGNRTEGADGRTTEGTPSVPGGTTPHLPPPGASSHAQGQGGQGQGSQGQRPGTADGNAPQRSSGEQTDTDTDTGPGTATGPETETGPRAADLHIPAAVPGTAADTGTRTGDPVWDAARAGTDPVTRSHTWVDPVSTPPDPQHPGRTTQFVVHSKFDARRFEHQGEWVTDLTVTMGSGGPDGLPESVWDKVRSGVEDILNAPGHRLPNGDLLHVTVEQVANDPHPNGLNVQFIGRDQQMTRSAWWADADPIDYVHEITHQLGLRDESPHASVPHRPDIEGSLLGDYTRAAPAGLAQGGLRDRHLHLIAAHIGDLTPAAPGPAGGRRPPADGTVPPPAVPLPTVGRRLGAEPYAPVPPRPAVPPEALTSDPATEEVREGEPVVPPGTDQDQTLALLPKPTVRETSGETTETPLSKEPQKEPEKEPEKEKAPENETKEPEKAPPKAKEWITTTLDRTRPPRIDRRSPRPLAGRRDPVEFDDGSRMPAYIDDIQSLLPDLPDDVLAELLVSSVSFGHSELALRGIDQVVAEIARTLRRSPAVRPKDPKPGGPVGVGLMADVTSALTHEPKSVTGEGRVFTYTSVDGSPRKLWLVARPYGDWERFTDAYGNPAKVDGMSRAVTTAGQSKIMQSVTQIAAGGPIGPAGTAAFSGFGRLGLRFAFTNKVGYTQTDQGTNQMETRALDGSHVHLDNVYYDVRVTDADDRPVTGPETLALTGPGDRARDTTRAPALTETGNGTDNASDSESLTGSDDQSLTGSDDLDATDALAPVTPRNPALFGFAVRHGLTVRLPDSVTKKARPGRIPRSIVLSRNSGYRLVRSEGFGPVAKIRDWAAGEIAARPGSTAYRELNAFFSTESFQRHAREQANGRVTTVPLFADDKAKTPLGVFVVDVEPVRAILITETRDAEMRDINTSAVRNERSLAKTAAFGVDGVAGPAFNLLDLGNGVLNLRLQFGPAFRYLFSVSRSAVLGGSGAIKSSGQVKGDLTGLYLVQKTVHVSRSGSGAPPRAFHTWSVDRMTPTEARRLAGWDDGTRLTVRNGMPEPFAPAYLTRDRPPLLGMHRVEEFTFDDGLRTRAARGAASAPTFLDAFADDVLAAIDAAYPGLVAPLDQLAPPTARSLRERARALLTDGAAPATGLVPSRWRNAEEYQTALSNTLEVLAALSHQTMSGNLEALTTTGTRIRLNEPGRIGQGHRYVWLRGELTNRRYEGRQDDLKLRYSSIGVERLDGQKGAKRIREAGFDGQAAFRDTSTDDIGAPSNAGVLAVGARGGLGTESETGFGATATNEPMAVSLGPSHQYRYDISLTVDRGGYWRFRGLFRGVATLGLLGTQPFVISQPRDVLIGRDPAGRPVGGGPRTGQVLISIPDRHAPSVDPHAPKALNPYLSLSLRGPLPVQHMKADRARALALGDLSRRGPLVRTEDLVGSGVPALPGAPAPAGGRGSRMFQALQNHPFLIVSVAAPDALLSSLNDVLRIASGGAWQLTEEGTPTRESVLRAFQPQYLTANFDQSSGPLGWSENGLMGKGPYATLWATFRHLTAVADIQALTGAVPMDTEMTLGGTGLASGKSSRTTSFFSGGQLVYAKPHGAGPGLLGNYGLVVSPYSSSNAKSRTVIRTVVADMNRKGFGHHVLAGGTAEHWLALASSLLGTGAVGKPFVPKWLAGAAGQRTTVPGGWLAHVPEKSAYAIGLLDDGLGEMPRYTELSWSPQPWLKGNNFGTYPVNSLNPLDVLAAFNRKVSTLGLDSAGQERIRTLVSARVMRSLDKEMTGVGSSVPVRTGAWGWHSVRIGSRHVRVRARLIPGTPTFELLDHSVEMEENRRAIETVGEGSDASSGADLGYLVSEMVHTGDRTAAAAGPTYTETGSGRRTFGSSHAVTTLTVFRAASTEPYAEIATPYRLQIALEMDDEASADGDGTAEAGGRSLRERAVAHRDQFTGRRRITEEGDIGSLREHVPLSLMVPDPGPEDTPVDPRLAPPRLTGLRAPAPGFDDYMLGPDTRHADGTLKPFVFPPHGFDVRRIVGLGDIQAANTYAIALSYDAAFSFSAPDSLRRAEDTALTRPGTGSAQALEDGTTNAALTAFFSEAAADSGYQVAGLTEKNLIGTESARLDLRAKPDFSRALLLTVADGMKMEVLSRVSEGASTSVARENAQDSAIGAGVMVSSPQTGLNQLGASGTGPYAAEGDGITTGVDQLASINVKPKTGRAFLFAIPTAWLSVAEVRRGIKDTSLARAVGGTFGHVRPGLKTVTSEAFALAWIRDDIAKELGLINDTNFPERVGDAWDAVTSAAKAFVAADQAYVKKRRTVAGLRAELEAARLVLDAAETAAAAATRRLETALDSADLVDTALDRALSEQTRDLDIARRGEDDARRALDSFDGLDESDAAHEDWAELLRDQIETARRDLAAAELAATALRTAAAARVSAARARKEREDRRLAGLRGAADSAGRQVERATARRDAARTALESREAEIAELEDRAKSVVSEYHRVRGAADRLTRWHQEAATAEGRARLGDLEEPPPVTFRAPPKPVAPPEAAPPPAYTRTSTDDGGTLLVSPENAHYTLHDVPRDGDAFLHALAEGLERAAPGLLAEHGVDLTDRPAASARLRELLASRLSDPSDADLLDLVAPDETDTFTADEVAGAGLGPADPGGLGQNTPGRREFDALGGLIPHSVRPDAATRAALAAAQIRRPGNAPGETGWNHSAGDLLPILAARTFGAHITVVGGDGRFQDFTPGTRADSGQLKALLDGAEPPRPHVVLSLDDQHYQLAVAAGSESGETRGKDPESAKPKGEEAKSEETRGKGPESEKPKGEEAKGKAPESERSTDKSSKDGSRDTSAKDGKQAVPPAPNVPARGEPVRVPATGECLLFSFMASDPAYVRDRLPGLATDDPAAYAWLGDADQVRDELSSHAEILSTTAHLPAGLSNDVVVAMRTHVAEYVSASGGRLHPQIVRQLRMTTESDFARRLNGMHRARLVSLLAHHDVDWETLVDRSDAGLRNELTALYATSPAPLDKDELAAVMDAVTNWQRRWMTPVGEVFLPLLAHAFGARVEVARNARLLTEAGPGNADRVVEVHYNGSTHYNGSAAGARDLLAFGGAVLPKRIKDEELDAEGHIRANPLWTPLDEVDPDLLITANRDAVWIYTVTGDGRVLLGSEKPSAIITPEQFDALLAGMRKADPDLTAESLRGHLDGLGHTGIAARFDEDGETLPGMSRVSGEFLWSPARQQWTVNDKSGRYMSESVRPGLDPEKAGEWLENIARQFSDRLGVVVRPDQVKTAAPPPPAPPPPAPLVPVPPPPPPAPPLTGAAIGDTFAEALLREPALQNAGPVLPDDKATIADLAAVGVTLSAGRATQAVLLGGSLSVVDAGLTPLQYLRLLLRRGSPAPGESLDTAAAVAAATFGVDIVVGGPGEQTRRFGPGTGPEVRLFFDGTEFTPAGTA
ncbi:hypothetical protein ABZ707_12925 [Streptomyces sp. NPDC006923]|uniref:hypothetical protein n=1 Tax=Streptomyces sp. NPDC006923 TaxID=3155355 RepID=UPI0033D1CF94